MEIWIQLYIYDITPQADVCVWRHLLENQRRWFDHIVPMTDEYIPSRELSEGKSNLCITKKMFKGRCSGYNDVTENESKGHADWSERVLGFQSNTSKNQFTFQIRMLRSRW